MTSGVLELGDQVTWRARHLDVLQELTSRITGFDRPRHFRDEMVRGAFARLVHDHFFERTTSGTTMRDVLDYSSPFGFVGRLVEYVYLDSYPNQRLQPSARWGMLSPPRLNRSR